jgi:trimeric autotransporter adhesin
MRRYVFGSILASILAGGTQGCTSSQTSTAVTSPASVKCQVQVGSPTTDFTSDGGKGTLAIATTRDCTWTVSTSATWVSVANMSGQGEASVPYAVAANTVPVARAAQIAVSDATLQLSQDAAPCRFALSSSSASVAAAGGPVTVQLSTLTGCAWKATTDATWLTIASGASGNTAGTIGMSAASNTGAARTAHMAAGGLTFTVTQAAGKK